MKSQAHIYYQELVENPVSITGMSVREKLSALEYAKEVRDQQEDLIQRMIVGSPSYKYPKEYLPDHKFEYWESKEGKVTKAVNVIALIEANLPAYNKPGEKVAPDVKKEEVALDVKKEVTPVKDKGDKEPKPASAETCALFHYMVNEMITSIPKLEEIRAGREKDGIEIGRRRYRIKDGERFYKRYRELERMRSVEVEADIKALQDYMKERIKKQTFILAQEIGYYDEYRSWWKTMIE